MTKPRRCKDCPPDQSPARRPATYRGPRCYTHWKEKKEADKQREYDRSVQKIYGLEPGERERLYEWQGGVCAICRRATGKTRRLSVDHDHATGKVRGLLCRPCNDMLGHARDELAFFARAAGYLRKPPYERMRSDGSN